MRRSEVLRTAIEARRAVVVPGCHDALSARVVESCGFEAVQVSGFGLAASMLAAPDVGLLQMQAVLNATWNIVQAVDIPVMADVDTGGGNAVNAAWVTGRLVAMGVAGTKIGDQVFPKRCGHLAGKEVAPVEEMEGKVRACVDVRDRLDPSFVVNARTDVYAIEGLDAAVERCASTRNGARAASVSCSRAWTQRSRHSNRCSRTSSRHFSPRTSSSS